MGPDGRPYGPLAECPAKPRPNPRNCTTCEFGSQMPSDGFWFCTAPIPLFVPTGTPRVVANPQDRCDAHKTAKGTFVRICLNCGNPIRTHHKYSKIGRDQWIHKCCEHPNSCSKFHYEKYATHRVGKHD